MTQKKIDFNPYLLLGLDPSCDDSQIDKAYKKSALRWHPDKNPDNKEKAQEMFIKIYEAYEFLKDKALRINYDEAAVLKHRRAQYEELRRSTSSSQRKEFLSKLNKRESEFEKSSHKRDEMSKDAMINKLRREGAEMLKKMKSDAEQKQKETITNLLPTQHSCPQIDLDELEKVALSDIL